MTVYYKPEPVFDNQKNLLGLVGFMFRPSSSYCHVMDENKQRLCTIVSKNGQVAVDLSHLGAGIFQFHVEPFEREDFEVLGKKMAAVAMQYWSEPDVGERFQEVMKQFLDEARGVETMQMGVVKDGRSPRRPAIQSAARRG